MYKSITKSMIKSTDRIRVNVNYLFYILYAYRILLFLSPIFAIKTAILSLINFVYSISQTPDEKYTILTLFGLQLKINNYKMLAHRKYKIQKNKIVFSNFQGKAFGCNPKYLAKEIIKQKLPYELVWLTDKTCDTDEFPIEIRTENYHSKRGLEELLTAGIWIDNTRKPFFWSNHLKKSKEQIYIQTWHGSLGIKKMEGDIPQGDKWWLKYARIDSQNIDYIISNSKFLDDLYSRESCFFYNGKILRYGHPRNDIFFKTKEEKDYITNKVNKTLNLCSKTIKLLYVPTFRDDGNLQYIKLDFKNLKNSVEKKFNKKCQIILRLHPNIPTEFANYFINENIINATNYPDIQELLLASDIVISDYSSCMFDFILTKRPVFVYAEDIDKYNNDRGFYYPLESTPFPIATNNEELAQNILNFDYNKYKSEVEEFLKKHVCVDDGYASERVIELIKKLINGEK